MVFVNFFHFVVKEVDASEADAVHKEVIADALLALFVSLHVNYFVSDAFYPLFVDEVAEQDKTPSLK